jgi:formylglycine-generating enzyme required for sulfatase activity
LSDEERRALEREILAAPASLEHRRRHAQLLLRSGDEERGLAALDLAWRLGAEDLWDELQGRLRNKTRHVRGIELRYVPAGPFVMGSDELDGDATPAHLVWLSTFYVARKPLTWRPLEGWTNRWPLGSRDAKYEEARQKALDEPITNLDHASALQAIGYLNGLGSDGEWALITEAQWERVFRAGYLRPDGTSPYDAVRSTTKSPEWTADAYNALAYASGPRRDPVASGGASPADTLRVVRGVAELPPPHFAIYREAALSSGEFEVQTARGATSSGRSVNGFGIRLVFAPR